MLPETALPERTAVRTARDGVDVLLYRVAQRVYAVANRCTHQGAPLHRGRVRTSGSVVSVSCPIHGSTFMLSDGRVLRGPAMDPLPAYETRVVDGTVEIRPLER